MGEWRWGMPPFLLMRSGLLGPVFHVCVLMLEVDGLLYHCLDCLPSDIGNDARNPQIDMEVT